MNYFDRGSEGCIVISELTTLGCFWRWHSLPEVIVDV
jgi:hypothetical protein